MVHVGKQVDNLDGTAVSPSEVASLLKTFWCNEHNANAVQECSIQYQH